MYIYITQQCQDNAEKYYIQPKITELYDNSEVLDLFDPIYPYWKRRIEKYRLLAKIEEVDNEKILCLLNILERKSQEYEEFTDKNKRQKFGQDKLESLLNDDEIKEWLNEQKESVCQQQNKREPLPNDLLVWLELPSWSKDSKDLVIYESEQWLKKCGQERIKDRRETFKNIILDIISQNDVEDESTSCSRVKLYSDQGKRISKPIDIRVLRHHHVEINNQREQSVYSYYP
jgi:mRNA-degrading endonuclease RelE of RelBE toxin-antitoxin system